MVNLKITVEIKEAINADVLIADIFVNGEWKKEIFGFSKINQIFKELKVNEDFGYIIDDEIHNEEFQPNGISDNNTNFLTTKLHPKEQAFILDKLFGFHIIDDIIYDDQEEFYGMNKNDIWDLFTLNGILKYHEYVNKIKGKNELRNLLNELSQLE